MDERHEKLQEYILLCVRDSKLQWADLLSPSALEKIMKTLSTDVLTVLKNLGRIGGGQLLQMAVAKLMAPPKRKG